MPFLTRPALRTYLTPNRRKVEAREAQRELSASCEHLAENNKEKNIFSNMFKKTQKLAAEGAKAETEDMDTERRLSASSENLTDPTGPKEKKGGLAGKFKRSSSFDNLLDEDKNIFSGMFKRSAKPAEEGTNATGKNTTLFGSAEDLQEANPAKEKTGGLTGFCKKSPKPSPRSVAAEDPLTKQLSSSWDSLTEAGNDDSASQQKLSASTDDLCDTSSTTKEKKARMSGIFRRTPRNTEQQEDEDATPPAGRGLSCKRTIKKKQRVVSFRVKKTLPRMSNEKSSEMPVIEESVEMEELNTPQERTVVVEPVEMAAYPTEESVAQMEQENNELMEWWNSAEGWTEWNETSNFQEEDEQIAMEQAADRVYMAASVFVHLFNQRGASLQHRILELLAMADAADEFHKKTVSAAVGGGVASVAGSVATITGLILAPFTFGASIIVTAVGIGVATAGSITSATANITDTVHSNMDRKKVEKMIQGYQEEIQDIRMCLEFVQEGMNTLEEWDFEKYSESATKKALNHNIKHVMKEGSRAGKALMINTDKLISTVQVLGAAGGAAKAVKAVSVTTGVMSALFLALDIFFLAKDSHTLHKGAKTKFAAKIRQVCKDLQEGLLELNKVKTQLQKTMDGIEVEEYEDVEEVEVEVEDEFEPDPKKLAELEQEIDFLEEKLDKKEEEVEPKKSKETTALDIFKIKEKKEEKSMKEKDVAEKREDEEPKKSKESVLDIFKIKKEKKEEKSVKEKKMEEKEEEPKKNKESELDIFKIKKEKSVEKTVKMEEKKDDEEPKKSKESVLDIFKIRKKEEKIMKEHEVEEKEKEVEPKKSNEVTADIFKIKKEKKEEKCVKEHEVEEKEKEVEPKKSKEVTADIFKIKKEKKEEKRMKEKDVAEKREDEEPKKSKESVLDIFKIKKEKKEEKSMKEQEVEEKDKGEKMSESKSEKKVNETSVKAEKDVLKEQFEKGSKKEKETGNQTSPGKRPEKKPEKSKEPNKTPEIKTKPENEQKERGEIPEEN
uniref:Apolipoprotein L domain containing 1a n=2 Tax=Xiphophorus maculatus TaxID=8083 RepID=A0A3B5Q3C7_XIPMA